ncbi:MAG: FAD-dependent oxidoreductase [Cyanobacteria bacterium J06554_3]
MKTHKAQCPLEASVLPSSRRPRVVIVGAGFAGLRAAQHLANTAFDVVLLSRDNYHTFQPLLHQVALLPTLQVADSPNIYFVGDTASLLQTEKNWPQLAAVAVQQGKAVADNLLRQSIGKVPLPFHYHHRGSMAILSRYAAVVQLGKIELTGFIAWILWLGVHLALLRGHRSSTLLQWWNSQGRGERSAQILLSSQR